MRTFQEMIQKLDQFWAKQGCVIHVPYDLEMGAGTFHPTTFLRCFGPEPYRAACIQPCRRPTDGRYGINPNRTQLFHQYQVMLKPSPPDIQELYLKSLEAIGFDLKQHDIRFVHDDWEAPTLGAWGLGWEVWIDGMEITQFTYFQCAGGINMKPVTGELAYGLERLAMYLQKVDSFWELKFNEHLGYADVYRHNEVEWSAYNFEHASTDIWFKDFDNYEKEAKQLLAKNLPLPAYDFVMKASHAFNILDARGVISVTERTGYITRIRDLARQLAEEYVKSREKLGHPLLNRWPEKKPPAPPAHHNANFSSASTGKEDFLLEIGSEELPAILIKLGCQLIKNALKTLLDAEGISYSGMETYGTPRRIALHIRDLDLAKKPQKVEKRGPRISAAFDEKGVATPAGAGFFRSIGIEATTLDTVRQGQVPQISIQEIKGDEFLWAELTSPGYATGELLKERLPKIIADLDFPKKMRWGDLDISYPRPIHWIVALLGKQVIPFSFGDIFTGKTSRGHTQLDNKAIEINHPGEYLQKLREHKVMASIEERQKCIEEQLDKLEKTLKASIIERERVLPQVVNLVEWPMVTAADFDPSFLKAPKEVLISEMVEHQKYFPVMDSSGNLINTFIITANNTPSDEIRHGNKKVLSARLADGTFLFDEDLKTPLQAFNAKLEHMTFQKELGSVFDKVKRIGRHAASIHRMLNKSNSNRFHTPLSRIERAALICKADLASDVVFEFPDLQGIMGRYYAQAQGEDPDVAQAIEEHWMPRGEGSDLPQSELGFILSLADKIDNILGCFLIGLKPTSSSDPYSIRRQVLGIIRMLIQREVRLPLMQLFRECTEHFPKELHKGASECVTEIDLFFSNRIKTIFETFGLEKDEINASLSSQVIDIFDTFRKVQALHKFRQSNEKFSLLLEVYKRARGQLEGQQTKEFHQHLLQEQAEIELDELLSSREEEYQSAIGEQRYDQAYEMIADLQPKLVNLFDTVRILADDPALKNNRIALLRRVIVLFEKLLDLSKIQEARKVSKS